MNPRGRPFVPPRADLPPWSSRTKMACCDPSICWPEENSSADDSSQSCFDSQPLSSGAVDAVCALCHCLAMDIRGLMRALNSLLSGHREHRRAWWASPTHQKMVKTELRGVRGILSRIARIEFPRTLAYTLVALFVLLYVVVYVNTPILIWTVGDHDDGL